MHSDIKSRNVLLSGNHEVAKISDVGFAKFLYEGASATQENYVAWTFAYAAPEILMNQSSGAEVSFAAFICKRSALLFDSAYVRHGAYV